MTTKHTCARCGREDVAERMVYSTHSGLRYCRDLDACARRARRRKKP